MTISKVCESSWQSVERQCRILDRDFYPGDVESLQLAQSRLGFPVHGLVYLWHHRTEKAVHIRTRDVVMFEHLLWEPDTWLIDEHAGWIVGAVHNRSTYWQDVRGVSQT